MPYSYRIRTIAGMLVLVFALLMPVPSVCESDSACSDNSEVFCNEQAAEHGEDHEKDHHCTPDCWCCSFTIVVPEYSAADQVPLLLQELVAALQDRLPDTSLPPPDHPPRLFLS